jgi:Uma2 family endonuclease
MTTARRFDHLLTLDEWEALPEDEFLHNAELVEGVVYVPPSPVSDHQLASALLCAQLNQALVPGQWVGVPHVDVVLVDTFPPTVRTPDISIVSLDAARARPKRYQALQLRVAVEIISPGSRRIDRVLKFAEYAEVGIPHYWIVELADAITLDTFRLVDGAYEPQLRSATGTVQLDSPVPLQVDLDGLRP